MLDSPFKFLNAYEKEDADIFFGREREAEELYEMTFDTNLMLVVGASGTGKSSLIQCGLSNKFRETRWNDIFVKRETNINASLKSVLDKKLQSSGGIDFGDAQAITDKLKNIYRATFKQIFLIFDQFEELFTVKSSDEEQNQFFNTIQLIITASFPCKVLLIMRDEFTPQLWKYESIVPTLFEHRYRVEKMRPTRMKKVVSSTLDRMYSKHLLAAEDSDQIGKKVVNNLSRSATGLELTYLQVYLDRLYRDAGLNKENLLLITPSLVDEVKEFDDILESFLKDQLSDLGKELNLQKKEPIRLLGEMITDDKTKKVLDKNELAKLAPKYQLSTQQLESCLKAYTHMRIIRQYDDSSLELTHDVLGPKIWELLPPQDQQLRIIRNSFIQRYNDYRERVGSHLGLKEVNSWSEYFPLLGLTNDQEQFIEDSKKEIGKKTRNRRYIRAILGLLFVIAAVTSIWALINRNNLVKTANELSKTNVNLQEAERNATELSSSLLSAFKELGNTQYYLYYENAIQSYDDTNLEDAEKSALEAKSVISNIVVNLRERKIKDSLISSFQFSVDSNGTKVDKLLIKINENKRILEQFRDLVDKGNKAEFAKDYVSAIQFYEEANQLMTPISSLNKLQMLKEEGYQYYFNKALSHMDSKTAIDYEYALRALINASRIYNRDTLKILSQEIDSLISNQ